MQAQIQQKIKKAQIKSDNKKIFQCIQAERQALREEVVRAKQTYVMPAAKIVDSECQTAKDSEDMKAEDSEESQETTIIQQ